MTLETLMETLRTTRGRRSRNKIFLLLVVCGSFLFAKAQEEGNGLFEMFRKLQEMVQGPSASSSPEGKNTRYQTSDRDAGKRQLTNRRELFEFTLHTHFSNFLPSGIDDEKEKSKESLLDFEESSWLNHETGCLSYNKGNSSYWTFTWCPLSQVSQTHKEPSQNLEGHLTAWKVSSHMLGMFEKDQDKEEWKPLLNIAGGSGEFEFYAYGDYCYPSEDNRLRSKIRRRTLVIRCKDCELSSAIIEKVVEPEPCQYIFYVCHNLKIQEELHRDESEARNNQFAEIDSMEEATESIGKDDDFLELIEDIKSINAMYMKISGVDATAMLTADQVTSLHDALPPLPPSRKAANLKVIREMFMHAYDSYMYNAYPSSELKPLTCQGGNFDLVKLPALTLIDSLDTLVIMKNFTEFARGVERLRDLNISLQNVKNERNAEQESLVNGGIFSVNVNVSLFETNIRVLGGLLSAHQLAVAYLENQVPAEDVRNGSGKVIIGTVPSKAQIKKVKDAQTCKLEDGCIKSKPLKSKIHSEVEKEGFNLSEMNCNNDTDTQVNSETTFWTYDGFLLELAHDIGKRLLPAFQTKTGIPYGTVNLLHGIPKGESKIASLAGAGTLSIEFELLSRLTGDESFGNAAKLATRALWMRRTKKNLLGKHINIEHGSWTETLSGIGSNSDSFYEYLVKHYLLFPEDEDFWTMFMSSYYGVHNESRLGEWYGDVEMNAGRSGSSRRVFESLMAFYPGMQVLLGEVSPAAKTLNGFFLVREAVGLLPERFNYGNWKVEGGNAGLHPLRPELLESCYFLHKSTEGISSMRSNSEPSGHSGWLWAADYALYAIYWHTLAKCGFSSITGVSPEATGGVPNKVRRQNAKRVDEMPSFFLSETLKYLFLMFDDHNILHQDDDRQWIFTTEAHPVHHAPLFVDMDLDRPKLRNRVYNFLLSRRSGERKQYVKSYAPLSTKGKWTEKSSALNYAGHVADTENEMPVRRKSQLHQITSGYELLQNNFTQPSFLPIGYDDGFGYSQQDASNIAHLSLSRSGMVSQSMAIVKGCPNVYSPSFSWINALSGGATDYSSVYISTILDETPTDRKYGVGLLSASQALVSYASGTYLGKSYQGRDAVCLIDQEPQQRKGEDSSTNKQSTQRFDMGGVMGAFDVALREEGNGFTVTQLNSGESIAVTVFQDEAIRTVNRSDINTPYVLLSSTNPKAKNSGAVTQPTYQSSSWLPGMNWKLASTRKPSSSHGDGSTDDTQTSRNVIIGDGSGRSFSCEIQLVSRSVIDSGPFSKTEPVNPIEVEQVIKSFPCAPALFGSTVISRLTQTNGITVEGNSILPDERNVMGCNDIDNSNLFSNEPQIRLVHRGVCTFHSKAKRQQQFGAEAVIVVNSDAHDLFLMAAGSEKEEVDQDVPVTTLISGQDGLEMLRFIREDSVENLITKISISPRTPSFDEKGNLRKGSPLPILQASSEAIQIFAAGGWGVHAVDTIVDQSTMNGKEQDQVKKEWQLFLLQHSKESGNESN